MKPFVVIVKAKEEKITLTKEELEEIIEKAYNQGVSDGNTVVYPSYPYPYHPVIYDTGTGTPWWRNPYVTITCGGIDE